MYGGVHFQECYNRDGGYCSNMLTLLTYPHAEAAATYPLLFFQPLLQKA